MHNKETNALKLGNDNFKLSVNESSLLIYYLDDKITKCYIKCKFDEGKYDGLDVVPNLEIGDIPVSKNKIEELTGILFEINDVNESFERGDSFYLTESEPFINYKVEILEIDNTMAHVLINGICITDGYSKPYKTDDFIVDAIVPIEIYESKKVVEMKKPVTKRNNEEKYVNFFMFILFGLIGGYYVFWSFYQFIMSFFTIFVLLLTVFCWYKVFKIYREIAMNNLYLKRKTLIDIISKKDYSDYDKILLLKKEIEKYEYYYDKRFMPSLKGSNIQWRQYFLKEEAKNHIKEGDIDFAYKNLFELIRAENPVLHGSNIHKIHFYSSNKKEHENYYKDGFICEKEKQIITEMINAIEEKENNNGIKMENQISKSIKDILTEDTYNKLKNLYIGELDIVFFEKENIDEGQYGFRYNALRDEIINEWPGNEYVIIGYDLTAGCGPDPYIMKTDEKELPIYWLMTDGGDWKNPDKIANSFNDFIKIIACINENLNSENGLNKELILSEIGKINSNENMEYWKSLLENDIDSNL